MKYRKCNKCKKTKSFSDFTLNKRNKDGLKHKCKKCCQEYQESQKGRESQRKSNKKYRHSAKGIACKERWENNNPDYNKEYRKSDTRQAYTKQYYKDNKTTINKCSLAAYWADPEKNIKASMEWQKNNPKKVKGYAKKARGKYLIYSKRYRKTHKKEFNEYQKERSRNNLDVRLSRNISSGIYAALRDKKNGRHWESLMGYTLDEFKEHMESLFLPGMTWGNYGKGDGKWHIDHIIPVSLFNITSNKCKGLRACWALENLRPMWGVENIRKGNKLFY